MVLVASLLAVALAGCGGDKLTAGDTKAATKPVKAMDFRSPTAAAGPQNTEEQEKQADGPSVISSKPLRSGPVSASDGILDVTVEPGEPDLEAVTAKRTGAPVFVDAKVGDVNNRAIYASAFLEPMVDRLTQKYHDLKAANPKTALVQWRAFAKDLIYKKLNSIIEDEVLRAEALNALQPEQKAGFFTWLQAVRSEVVAENRGIEAAANENLSAQNGTSLDQTMKNREQQELIKFILYSKVYNRANVSWRDIQQAFEKNYETFNPKPTAFFRTIMVSTTDKAKIARITELLGAGNDFDEVATDIAGSDEAAEEQVKGRQFDGEYNEYEFYGVKELNDAVHSLTPGKWVGPISVRSYTYWIKLEQILRLKEDLYEAQLFLENRLIQTRQDWERMKFVARLKSRATFTDIELMTNRMMRYAEERVMGLQGPKDWVPPKG